MNTTVSLLGELDMDGNIFQQLVMNGTTFSNSGRVRLGPSATLFATNLSNELAQMSQTTRSTNQIRAAPQIIVEEEAQIIVDDLIINEGIR